MRSRIEREALEEGREGKERCSGAIGMEEEGRTGS